MLQGYKGKVSLSRQDAIAEKTYQAASQVVSIEVMLQEAGETKEGQAELLEVELDRLRGPHTGAQLDRETTVTLDQ